MSTVHMINHGMLRSSGVVMDIDNIDTDMIIPKQFLKTVTRVGLGQYLFFEQRYHEDGSMNNEFILNMKPWCNSKILIAGKNFGCGSSREHAPWALYDFGIRCIIAESFADIFYGNCFENRILPIILDRAEILRLARDNALMQSIDVDLEKQTVVCGEHKYSFDIDQFKKYCLLNGLDSIGLTLQKIDKIEQFERLQTDD